MMALPAATLFLGSAAIYLAATLGFVGQIVFRHTGWLTLVLRITIVGFCLHTAWLAVTLLPNGYPFIVGNSDAHRLVSWIVIVVFFCLSRFAELKNAGAIFVPVALVFFILSSFQQDVYRFGSETISSPWVLIHLLFAFIAFAIFLVSLVVGVAFILQEAQLKAKRLGRLVQKLPPLAVLDQIHYKALAVGLILLTAAILAGMALNKDLQGVFFTWDPKQIWVLSTWLLYALLLNLRIQSGWRGRRGIFLSILGFVVVVLVFFGLQHSPAY